MAVSHFDKVRAAYVLLKDDISVTNDDIRAARENIMEFLMGVAVLGTTDATAEDITAIEAEVDKRGYFKNTSGSTVVIDYGGEQYSLTNNSVMCVLWPVWADLNLKYPGKFTLAARADFETGTQGQLTALFDS